MAVELDVDGVAGFAFARLPARGTAGDIHNTLTVYIKYLFYIVINR